ncbi:hypothetical protein ABIB40_002415 [Pedobacter sp. UYP30]|uniref:DUF4286 family protein n=1 Tax=Pedobacter sp. UYP30 TaxID=1756400 RepID=UPI00339690C7
MLLYNVTLILEESIANEWLDWMQKTHIPAVMDTEKFLSHRLLRVVDSPNEGVTYCTQYVAESDEKYKEYLAEFAPALQHELDTKFANKFVAYRTVMEIVG